MPFGQFANCLKSISNQNLLPELVIISDDSRRLNLENEIIKLCKDLKLNFIYKKNSGLNGMGGNSNFALSIVETEYVHILHSDDSLRSECSYEVFMRSLEESNCQWVFCSGLVNGNLRTAKFSPQLIMGINTLGGPSGMFTTSKNYVRYDSRFKMFVDIDQFLKIESLLGKPEIILEPLIEYGVGDWQVQKNVSRLAFYREIRMLIRAHPKAWEDITCNQSIQWNVFTIYTYLKLSLITFNIKTIKYLHLFLYNRIFKSE